MAFFMDPGAMFLGCLGPSEQKFLVTLIETAAKSGYTRFVEPCAGTFAMANLAVQNGFKPEQIETSNVNMMSTVLGYAITGQSLEPLEIHAQGFSDEELLDPATALYAQLYLRTSKNAGNDYFYQSAHRRLRDSRPLHTHRPTPQTRGTHREYQSADRGNQESARWHELQTIGYVGASERGAGRSARFGYCKPTDLLLRI